MAILLDQNLGNASKNTTDTSIALTTTAKVASDARIYVLVNYRDTAALISNATDNGPGLSWEIVDDTAINTPSRLAWLSAYAPTGMASGTIITVNLSGTPAAIGNICAASFTGVALAAPLDTKTFGVPVGSSWSQSITTLTPGDVALLGYTTLSGGATSDTPISGTEIHDFWGGANGRYVTTLYLAAPVPGSYTFSGTLSVSPTQQLASVITMKPEVKKPGFIVKKGAIVLPTVAGAVQVKGLGFSPKALIFWSNELTAAGFGAQMNMSFGFATSPTDMFSIGATALDATAAATATAARRQNTIYCLAAQMTAGTTAEMTLALASRDPDGFTLTLATPAGSPTAVIVHYLAFGGNDITDAFAGEFAPTSGTGNKAYTGVPFQPDFVLAISGLGIAVDDAGLTTAQFMLSAFTPTNQAGTTLRVRDSVNPTQSLNWQVARSDLAYLSTSDAIGNEATFVSMDAGGFTLNYTTRPNATYLGFLALKGGRYYVGTETQKTSVGLKSTTGIPFTPRGLLLFGANAVANASVDLTQAKLSIGASDGATEGSAWCSATDNVATSEAKSSLSTTKVIQHNTNPATTNAEADLVSFDGNGFTLGWTTADATAREFNVVAFGDNVGSVSSDTPIYDLGLGSA